MSLDEDIYDVDDHLTLSSSTEGEEKVERTSSYSSLKARGSVVEGETIDDISEYFHLVEEVGSGAFAEVWKAEDKTDGHVTALKFLPKTAYKPGSRLRTMVQREVELLGTLDHPNIVSLEAVLESEKDVILAMEYCYGGMLFDKVANLSEGGFDEELARALCYTLTEVVASMHSQGIAHRDLKLENLLLAQDDVKPEHLRVADFGFARKYGKMEGLGNQMTTYCGTPGYMAPEIFEIAETGGTYTDRSDVWSIGCIAHALLTGYLPFDADYASEIEAMSRFVPLTFPKSIWKGTSKRSRKFVKACLHKDPTQRPTTAELLKTRWLKRKDQKARPLQTSARLSQGPKPWRSNPVKSQTRTDH